MNKTESITLIRLGEYPTRGGSEEHFKVIEAQNVTSPHVDELLKRNEVDNLINNTRINVKIRPRKRS